MQYKFTYETQRKIDGRFYTQEVKSEGIRTDKELEQATSPETLRFFRKNLGSKQEIKRRYKDGKEIVYIYSYSPIDQNERHLMKYEEI